MLAYFIWILKIFTAKNFEKLLLLLLFHWIRCSIEPIWDDFDWQSERTSISCIQFDPNIGATSDLREFYNGSNNICGRVFIRIEVNTEWNMMRWVTNWPVTESPACHRVTWPVTESLACQIGLSHIGPVTEILQEWWVIEVIWIIFIDFAFKICFFRCIQHWRYHL